MIKLTKNMKEKHAVLANAALSIPPRSIKGKVRLKLYGIYRPGNA